MTESLIRERNILITKDMFSSFFRLINNFRNDGIDLESENFSVTNKIKSDNPKRDGFYTKVEIITGLDCRHHQNLIFDFVKNEMDSSLPDGITFSFVIKDKGYSIQSNV